MNRIILIITLTTLVFSEGLSICPHMTHLPNEDDGEEHLAFVNGTIFKIDFQFKF